MNPTSHPLALVTGSAHRLGFIFARTLAEQAPPGESTAERDARIAVELQARPDEVQSMVQRLSGPDMSLSTPVYQDGSNTLEDHLPEP